MPRSRFQPHYRRAIPPPSAPVVLCDAGAGLVSAAAAIPSATWDQSFACIAQNDRYGLAGDHAAVEKFKPAAGHIDRAQDMAGAKAALLSGIDQGNFLPAAQGGVKTVYIDGFD